MRNMAAARRIVLSLTVLVFVALLAYAGYWYHVAGMLRDQIKPWAQARADQGYLVHWDNAKVGGFPGSFRFEFTNLSVGTARPVPVAVDAASVSAWAMPWNLKHWEFTAASGAQVLDPGNSAGFTTRRLDGAVDVEDRAAAAIDVTAVGLDGVGLAHGIGIDDAEAHIELPAAPPSSHADLALGVSLQVGEATLPVGVLGFGHTLSGFSFAAQLKGALPPGPLPQALSAWRDSGGTVELQSLRIRWGSLLVDASGTLALDSALQPEGAFSAMITGQGRAVDVAVMTGALKPDQASAAKEVLALLPKPTDSEQSAITLPLTLQNDQLFLGPAKIASVPPIPWD